MEYQPPTPPPPQIPDPSGANKTSMGLEPNLAAALSYVCCWISGLIFFLVEKDNQYVRFHALQSLITFGALTGLSIILEIISRLPIPGTWILAWIGWSIIWLLSLIVFLVLVIKAYQGERYHLPVVGDIVERHLK